MRKNWILKTAALIVAIIAALIMILQASEAKAQTVQKTQDWMLGTFVDEFEDKTKEQFITTYTIIENGFNAVESYNILIYFDNEDVRVEIRHLTWDPVKEDWFVDKGHLDGARLKFKDEYGKVRFTTIQKGGFIGSFHKNDFIRAIRDAPYELKVIIEYPKSYSNFKDRTLIKFNATGFTKEYNALVRKLNLPDFYTF